MRAIALLLIIIAGALSAQTPDTLYLTHFDVGQGDATLITTYQGKRILIDAGAAPDDLARRLRAARIDTLDLVIASHNHEDHIGGMPAIFAAFVVRAYLDNGLPANTQVAMRTLAAAQREPGLEYFQATDRTIRVGEVTLRVLPPSRLDAGQNNSSVGILLEYGKFRALYTGDSEAEELSHWLAQKRIPTVQLLKAAHHGAENGVTRAFVLATRPAVVIISAGRANSYGHPDPRVLQAWTTAGAHIYRTDSAGTIQVNALLDGSFKVRSMPRSR